MVATTGRGAGGAGDYHRSPVLRARFLVLLALAAAVAGCGREVSREEYVQAVAAPLGQVDAALRIVEAASPDELPAAAEQARARLLAAADALDAIEPASGLSEAHRLLRGGVRELAGDVVEIARRGLSQAIPATLDAIQALPSLKKLQRAQELYAREEVTLVIGSTLPPETGTAETGVPETFPEG